MIGFASRPEAVFCLLHRRVRLTGNISVVMGYSNVQLLYSDSEAILSDVLVRYMTCKTRRISRQPYSAFDMGDFRVLATA